VDHPLHLHRTDLVVRPWRVAALALAGVAALELVLLVAAGGALLARDEGPARAAKVAAATAPSTTRPAGAKAPAAAMLPRRKVGVVVLNGNGRQGAAGRAASRVTGRGYRVKAVANAPAAAYPRSLVMYRPGFAPEARRLAKDLGVSLVSPLDGMRPGQLRGAHTVLILGGR
jgi:hypothetical protein